MTTTIRDWATAAILPTVDRLLEAVKTDENLGFCLSCGDEDRGVEPDARRYKCKQCGELRVYGAQELLIRFVK